jgi:hypothetical protein
MRHALANRIDLGHRAVVVVVALYREQRLLDRIQFIDNAPCPERRIQPDIVPAIERGIDIGMIAAELAAQIRGFVKLSGLRDALHRNVFDEYMRGDGNRAGQFFRVQRRIEQRDRAAVAMTDQPHALAFLRADIERVE